ncbi:hypothetical protein IW261DRAFT_1606118 [Armillaria novae-zelandiae]|uniref:C2H2-type domain-containing protein n=1 Tax=Armillaria novae-zelandiae TaxID=153914 RepID=A0AA39UIG9_9AGAR|nr:hypothetical protein IW261DRAFT_1606118 [Armillaria novae-zelandiae]
MSVNPNHYRPALVDGDGMDLDDIFDQFIEPCAFENCNQQLQQDSSHDFLYNEEGNWLGMNVNTGVTSALTFDEPICPKAALLSPYDMATTSEVVNRFDNDWFDSLWTSPSATGWLMQNTMEVMETRTFNAPSRSTTRNLDLRARSGAYSMSETSSSRGSTPPLNSRSGALSPANAQTPKEEDAVVPSFRCPWFECTSQFMSPEEALAHALYHPDRRELRCPHPDCTYTSVRINDVKRHCETATHGRTASFFCRGCGRKFTRKDAVKRHQSKSAKDPRCVAFVGSKAGVGVVGERTGYTSQ